MIAAKSVSQFVTLTDAEKIGNKTMKHIEWFTIGLVLMCIFFMGSFGLFAAMAALATTLSIGILFLRMYQSKHPLPRAVFNFFNRYPLILDILLTIGGFFIFGASGGPIGYFIGGAFGLFSSFMINWMNKRLCPVEKKKIVYVKSL